MDDFGVPLFKEISVGLDMFRESTWINMNWLIAISSEFYAYGISL